MSSESTEVVEKRKARFDDFYTALIPNLVEFVKRLGISPAHEVLTHAVQFVPHLTSALQDMAVVEDADRTWLITQVGYFVGEYFAQKYGGSWYVNDIANTRYFGQYVVGKFLAIAKPGVMIDPFQIAQYFVDRPPPRNLESVLEEVDSELRI